jgi:hypothetical protein
LNDFHQSDYLTSGVFGRQKEADSDGYNPILSWNKHPVTRAAAPEFRTLRCVWLRSGGKWNDSILFFYVWLPHRRAERLLKSINSKYLGCPRSTKTTGCERSRGRERSHPSPPLNSHMTLQPNNKRSGSALFYSSTKRKMERFSSACQTQNEIA